MKKIFKNISRVVWILSLISMFADVASEMLYPIIPVYLQSIGFSIFLIGLLEGLAEATSGLSKGYFGHWSDRIGRRMPFVRMGYFLSAIAKPAKKFVLRLRSFSFKSTFHIHFRVNPNVLYKLMKDQSSAHKKTLHKERVFICILVSEFILDIYR